VKSDFINKQWHVLEVTGKLIQLVIKVLNDEII